MGAQEPSVLFRAIVSSPFASETLCRNFEICDCFRNVMISLALITCTNAQSGRATLPTTNSTLVRNVPSSYHHCSCCLYAQCCLNHVCEAAMLLLLLLILPITATVATTATATANRYFYWDPHSHSCSNSCASPPLLLLLLVTTTTTTSTTAASTPTTASTATTSN